MRRGKEEEKTTGPMFPRLHVKDTAERGGPRAPPRNKMALYEQLSIPSQRFTSGLVPFNPQNKPPMAKPASSSQASGDERNRGFSREFSSPSPFPRQEKLAGHRSDGASGAVMASQLEPRQKREANEFTVPVFDQARVALCTGRTQHCPDREAVSSISSARSDHDPKRNDSKVDDSFIKEATNPSKENTKVVPGSNQLTRENIDGNVREASAVRDHTGNSAIDFDRSGEDEACVYQKSLFGSAGTANLGDGAIKSIRGSARSEAHRVEGETRPKKPENSGNINATYISLQLKRVEKDGNVYETPMVESTSCVDIAPDDVVELIGHNLFLKARKAIVNQQRVFSSQVFELHKLITVQRLIAKSPEVLLNGSFQGRSSLKSSPVKKRPAEFPVKLALVVNSKNSSDKPNDGDECSAENTVVKRCRSRSPTKNLTQSHPATTADNKAGPWCFPQPAAPQWLVPVMSPSEGLIYKPYPGPAPGAVYGGFGPFGNFTNSPNGALPPHPQGIGGFHGASPNGHPYFPYTTPAVPSLASEKVSPFAQSLTGPTHGTGASLNVEQESSCNAPLTRKQPEKTGNDLQQRSTASSSPGERSRDPLPLFPVGPVAQSHTPEKPLQVIKVVPHNRRSAPESAARIFRSIQEERKQYNFI